MMEPQDRQDEHASEGAVESRRGVADEVRRICCEPADGQTFYPEQQDPGLAAKIEERRQALGQIKILGGIVTIRMNCKKIRDDQGYWNQVEVCVRDHAEVELSHGFCPECMKERYPEFEQEDAGSALGNHGGVR